MKVTIRRFERTDIPKKVEWINNPENNKYLHYDIPICVEKTEKWFDSHIGDNSRFDAIIEADGIPVGTIGLLSIDKTNNKAEYYIAMGETSYKGKGIAKEASRLILEYAFDTLDLNRVYLHTEYDNIAAQKLFERVGFTKEGLIRQDLLSHGKYVDRYVYGCLKEEWNVE
ncbi:GNAT family N-acetyltransferase [Ruminococcus albus]|uniref:Protein N-acetyltransferase, RimJ/RimL family n=1 Tax=Ruminococcus albus TaxID=1264 RepID=A0A1H7KRA0_RUMAL|nr:GNAT family protein [Ruminococcus albus]SEK89094.1 Protein N-acetyltransferase, RimJ/RimL family [Ruminococcus albus]